MEKVDLQTLTDEKLVPYLQRGNAWQARHAQRILQERAQKAPLNSEASGLLTQYVRIGGPPVHWRGATTEVIRLRALWTAYVTGVLEPEQLMGLLADGDEYIRAWAIQFRCEGKKLSAGALTKMGEMARDDKSPVVRLYLAAAMQRLAAEDRWRVVEGLCGHAEDAKDHNDGGGVEAAEYSRFHGSPHGGTEYARGVCADYQGAGARGGRCAAAGHSRWADDGVERAAQGDDAARLGSG